MIIAIILLLILSIQVLINEYKKCNFNAKPMFRYRKVKRK